MSRALVLGLLLMFAVSVAASDAKRKLRPVRIVEPGALAYDYARDDLLVADRKLNRVVRIDLRSGKRRVAVTGLRHIVGLAYDDMTRLYVAAGDRIYRVAGGRKTLVAGNGHVAIQVTVGRRRQRPSAESAGSRSTTTRASSSPSTTTGFGSSTRTGS